MKDNRTDDEILESIYSLIERLQQDQKLKGIAVDPSPVADKRNLLIDMEKMIFEYINGTLTDITDDTL